MRFALEGPGGAASKARAPKAANPRVPIPLERACPRIERPSCRARRRCPAPRARRMAMHRLSREPLTTRPPRVRGSGQLAVTATHTGCGLVPTWDRWTPSVEGRRAPEGARYAPGTASRLVAASPRQRERGRPSAFRPRRREWGPRGPYHLGGDATNELTLEASPTRGGARVNPEPSTASMGGALVVTEKVILVNTTQCGVSAIQGSTGISFAADRIPPASLPNRSR